MCLYPIAKRFKVVDEKKYIIWSSNPLENAYDDDDVLILPCSKCVECLKDYSIEWSYRIMLESSLYKNNCFVTLTYKNAPEFVSKRDLQLFIKRLRKFLGDDKIRYYACGEYGSKKLRPHYHMIIFNYLPDDLEKLFISKSDGQIYTSKKLEQIWSKGFVSIAELTLDSACYVAKYMQKLQTSQMEVKPFTLMSRKPGIGFYNVNEKMISDDKVYHKGNYRKLPRYFLKVLERSGNDLEQLKKNRLEKSKLFRVSKEQLIEKRKKVKKLFDI